MYEISNQSKLRQINIYYIYILCSIKYYFFTRLKKMAKKTNYHRDPTKKNWSIQKNQPPLVGSFNPSEKYASQIGNLLQNRGEHKKSLKPPPSQPPFCEAGGFKRPSKKPPAALNATQDAALDCVRLLSNRSSPFDPQKKRGFLENIGIRTIFLGYFVAVF